LRNLLQKVFGTYSDRELKRITPIVDKIEALEDQFRTLSTSELRGKTDEFRERLKNGETLDDILPEAFATVREAADRVIGMRHFRVQLIGGVVLHQGRIAEMKTGEGKTLVATLPAYLNAIAGEGVHIITVNSYLAKRDSEWMGKIHKYLGLTVGLIVQDMPSEAKQAAYNADITYGTNSEFGFDYLRDNMTVKKESQVQRSRAFAIVDEVDSILIDEARTPLIISGASDKSTQMYQTANKFARTLSKHVVVESNNKVHDDEITADYVVDEKARSVSLTANGVKKAEKFFNIENLADSENMHISHHINQAIRAHGIMRLDIDYVVKDGDVMIVDEFTGRIMSGRRYSDGLHQAIEAKENVNVQRESQTLATITIQNFFRLYKKLSGMTGTAQTEEEEFQTIYNLDVIVIPTNVPVQRVDNPDTILKNELGKISAIINQVVECHEKGQPVLVGTISIEKSEEISRELKKRGVKHEVLNAKHHEKEAEIVAQAGKLGAVTIATNMAGRGTDITLGGNSEFMAKRDMQKQGFSEEMIVEATGFGETNDEDILNARKTYAELYDKHKAAIKEEHARVIEAGGLYIVGTERHESRRIDNQLRGRSGRQGDVGASRFFVSLEDDLMRLFGADKIKGMVEVLGLQDDQPIEAKMITGVIETAQKRVESRNFDSRKYVLQYDDVLNAQRSIVYTQRQKVLEGEDIHDVVIGYVNNVVDDVVNRAVGDVIDPKDWSWDSFTEQAASIFGIRFKFRDEQIASFEKGKFTEEVRSAVHKLYTIKEAEFGETMRELERVVLLKLVDQKWMDHIDSMEQLKQGIGLRAFGGGGDPVQAYKFESMDMFEEMVEAIKEDTVRYVLHANIQKKLTREQQAPAKLVASHRGGSANGGNETKKPFKRSDEKVGRNDSCPCGSGKKYKKCCGE